MTKATLMRADDLTPGHVTAGMLRREAFSDDDFWIGTATTEAGAVSAWHHHGDHDSYIYCVAGMLRIEAAGHEPVTFDAHAGDFVHIPARLVHRESNPSRDEQRLIVARTGTGPVVVNVDAP